LKKGEEVFTTSLSQKVGQSIMLPPGRLEADTTFFLLEIKAFSF